jgi:outer membrane protein assembly factor BamB
MSLTVSRMRVASVVTVLGIGAVAGLAAAPGSPMFRGDAEHTGVYDGPGVPTLHGVKWTFHTHGQIYASPAVVDGVAYIGSTDGVVYAVDAATGAQKWKLATRGRVVSSPAVVAGTVYVVSYDSKLYAIDAATGTAKWTFATAGEHRFIAKHIHGLQPDNEPMPDPFDFFLSSPAVADGVVYFGSGDGRVYAVDAASGALRWQVQTGNVVHASPAIANGVVYIGGWDTYFRALDAATGRELWKFKTGDDDVIHNQTGIQSSAAVANGLVYFGCRDAHLYALDAKTGARAWAYDTKGSWVIGSPAVKDDVVYFATADSGLFHAVDARNGAERFSIATNRWPMFSSPAIAGTLAYVGTHQGKLIAIDLAGQKLAWMYQTPASLERGPALTTADGVPDYAAAMPSPFYDDTVAGIQKLFSVGAILSSPVVVGSTIYVGSADGSLYAIG